MKKILVIAVFGLLMSANPDFCNDLYVRNFTTTTVIIQFPESRKEEGVFRASYVIKPGELANINTKDRIHDEMRITIQTPEFLSGTFAAYPFVPHLLHILQKQGDVFTIDEYKGHNNVKTWENNVDGKTYRGWDYLNQFKEKSL